jgi:hypothetical protein
MTSLITLLKRFVAPALPLPTEAYDLQYFNKLVSVLRIYFNQLDSLIGSLTGRLGGQFISFPYGAFASYVSQSLAVANTETLLIMTQTDFANGVTLYIGAASATASISGTNMTVTAVASGTLVPTMLIAGTGITAGTRIVSQTSGTTGGVGVYVVSVSQTISSRAITGSQSGISPTVSGIYNLQFSVQLQNLANSSQDVYIWLKQNGTDITGSTGFIGLPARKSPSDPYHDIKGWNYYLSMNAGDYVEIWWSTSDVLVTIPTYAASGSPTKPSTASVVTTMSFVSALPQ